MSCDNFGCGLDGESKAVPYKILQCSFWGLFLCLFLFVNTPAAFAKKQLSISPPTLKLSLSSGMSVSETIVVYNDGTENLPYIFLYPADLKVGEEGEKNM